MQRRKLGRSGLEIAQPSIIAAIAIAIAIAIASATTPARLDSLIKAASLTLSAADPTTLDRASA